MAGLEVKNLDQPDRTQQLPKGPINIVDVGGYTFGRAVFGPGWNFKECVMPTVKTDLCEQSHKLYIVSGRLAIKMRDGQEQIVGPGDAVVIEPGHDAWTVGDEACVAVDFRRVGEK